jgi:hypothetical protein
MLATFNEVDMGAAMGSASLSLLALPFSQSDGHPLTDILS